MSFTTIALVAASTLVFLGAASAAKSWATSADSIPWLATTLVLYTIGNLIMLKLIRDIGMGVALSLSAVMQLLAINLTALFLFGERLSTVQSLGLFLAVASVAMITLGAEP